MLFHHARVTVERTSEYRRRRDVAGGCGKCNRSAMHRLASSPSPSPSSGCFVRREKREKTRYRMSPSSCSPSSPYSCHPRHPLWTFDRSHPRCLPSGAQSRATTEIRLAIIVDKVEQCRTPVSWRTAAREGEGGGTKGRRFHPRIRLPRDASC